MVHLKGGHFMIGELYLYRKESKTKRYNRLSLGPAHHSPFTSKTELFTKICLLFPFFLNTFLVG